MRCFWTDFCHRLLLHQGTHTHTHTHTHIYRSFSYDRGPYPLPKRLFHRVQSNSSSFNFQCPLISLRLSNSCLLFLPCLSFTQLSSVFPSVMCFRRQFLRQMLPIHLGFLVFIVCRIFLSSLYYFLISHTVCPTNLHTHTHTYIYIYICIYVCI
jgi:hypothetical protein